jgi:hypothetical protein
MDTEGIRNSNFFGVEFCYSARELMQIEARRTRIEAIKREMGDKYLLAPLYTKLRKPLK